MSDKLIRGAVLTFGESIQICFSKYADFNGRASKSEFWWWVLFNFIASVALGIISDKLSLAFTVVTLLPYVAVTTRRLHDTDKGGWAQLIGLVPVIGWIIIIVWLCRDGDPGANRFGDVTATNGSL